MDKIFVFIKKIIPESLFKALQVPYHYVLNFVAALIYGFPSNKLNVVGITGTTGKTTAVFMTAELLKSAGYNVGYTSTAMFSDGEKEWLNDKKMTMVGRFFTQKMLRAMVKNGCEVAIVETTSEGVVQYRHKFINYDTMLFTGLYPEHIDSHGSFENYKNAKLQLFKHLSESRKKKLHGQNVSKTIIANLDNEHAGDFLNFEVDKKIAFTQEEGRNVKCFECEKINYKFKELNKKGVCFTFENTEVQMSVLGEFNATNATAAGCVGRVLGISDEEIRKGLERIPQLPGRLEKIEEGQDFHVIVDYAFEPVAVTELYETIKVLEPQKIIHVLGSAGGGRDESRRGELGKIAGEKSNFVIVTNEDPYDDDPMEIINEVAKGAKEKNKKENKDLFLIEDRGDAIQKAISLAQENDVVLVTGKGSEQAIVVGDCKFIPWDDRNVVREALNLRQ
ncbi:MAG: UDP-N-acetylmuramyl-tripeptide synthetase [Patescibacteria group bacterium]